MGAAFLAHQVTQLERSVDSITFSRDARLYDPSSASRRGRGPGSGGGRGGTKREVRVLDASALVHALPLLKKWIREDRYQLVVPLEGELLQALYRVNGLMDDCSTIYSGPAEESPESTARPWTGRDSFPRDSARHCSSDYLNADWISTVGTRRHSGAITSSGGGGGDELE